MNIMENTEIQITLEQGEGYFESGDIEAAKRCFKKILSSQPDHIESLNNLGVIYFQEGNLEPAIFSFEGVLKIDETYVEAMENLAKCLEVKGDYLESAKLYQKALKLGGLKVYILNSMANCFIQMEDLATAKQILTESSAIDNTQNDIETLLELIKSIECAQKTKPTHLTSNKGLRIGFVTLWYERGQAYITRMLQDSIVEEHETFILARNGGSSQLPLLATTGEWAVPNLTTFHEYKIPCDMLKNWIQKYQLDIVIFNEEYDFTLVREAKKCGAKTFGYYVWELFNPEWSKTVRAIYDKVICPTSCSHQRFIKLGIDNSVYLKWGVDRNLFHPVEKVIKKPIRFFHPAGWGGLHARRGTQYVIDAFRKAHIEDAELLIHTQQGKGKEQEGNITILHGTVPREELVQMYQESDVAVLPSKWEGLGLTFLEAISCGLPILTVDAPPMNEFVKNRETGFLCGITERCHYSDIFIEGVHVDTDDMAEKMHMMMDNTLRREMTEKTKAFASCFTRDQFKENLQNLLRDTIKQPHNEVRLNLGCGSDIRDGFVNIDRRKIDGVDLITDVSNLPYHDESVREIVAHDIIEHFPRGETEKVLTEWTRVLKQNGILKIQCPNVRDLSYALVSHQIPVKEFARRIYGGQEYDGNFHHTGFDIPEMKRVLHAIGMKPTQISAYNYNLFINAICSIN